MDPLFGLTTQTYVDGLHGPHPTQETALLRFYVHIIWKSCFWRFSMVKSPTVHSHVKQFPWKIPSFHRAAEQLLEGQQPITANLQQRAVENNCQTHVQWVGLREKLNRKPCSFCHSIWGFPANRNVVNPSVPSPSHGSFFIFNGPILGISREWNMDRSFKC